MDKNLRQIISVNRNNVYTTCAQLRFALGFGTKDLETGYVRHGHMIGDNKWEGHVKKGGSYSKKVDQAR